MKICVIGNSHIAALKLAWNDLADTYHDKVELVFFGFAGNLLEGDVVINNNCLVPRSKKVKDSFHNTSGGLTKINFADFDVVFLVGLNCGIGLLSKALKTHRAYDATSSTNDGNYKIISSSCIAQVFIDQIKSTSMFQITSLIRSISKIPVFIALAPFPSRRCTDNSFLTRNACKTVQKSYYEGIFHFCESFNATFIPQPNNTVIDFLFTKENLSKGSVRLDSSLKKLHDETDYIHMNQEYGKEVLTFALQRINR